jgi:hypothetical protein
MQITANSEPTGGRSRRGRAERLRWYQLVYWLIYRLGLIVWKRATPPAELIALVEGPAPLPAGRALDLGCGTAPTPSTSPATAGTSPAST